MEEKEDLPKSAGRPVFMCQVEIVDSEGKELGPNEPGVVMAKSPYTMKGYWNLPKKPKKQWRTVGS